MSEDEGPEGGAGEAPKAKPTKPPRRVRVTPQDFVADKAGFGKLNEAITKLLDDSAALASAERFREFAESSATKFTLPDISSAFGRFEPPTFNLPYIETAADRDYKVISGLDDLKEYLQALVEVGQRQHDAIQAMQTRMEAEAKASDRDFRLNIGIAFLAGATLVASIALPFLV